MEKIIEETTVETQSAYLGKFSNPNNNNNATSAMQGAKEGQCLMLSMKHSGSLIIISPTGRFSTKNGADSKFINIAYLVFNAWMGDDLNKFLSLIKRNKLSIGLELVVPRILGEHPGEALLPYFAVTSVTNVTTLQDLSQDALIEFCLNNNLPCGEHFFIECPVKKTESDDIIGEIDRIRLKNSGASYGDGGTSEFINNIDELTLKHGGIAFLGSIPHEKVQGQVCEGVIARILASSPASKIHAMNGILKNKKSDFDKRLENFKGLGEWFKLHYDFKKIFYEEHEIESFFDKVRNRVDEKGPLFLAKTGDLVKEKDRYWFLNLLKHSSTMGGEANLFLESLSRLSQLKKQWLSASKQNKTVSPGNINKVKSELDKLRETISEIYKSAGRHEDVEKLVSQLTSLDQKKVEGLVNGLKDKLKSLEEATLQKLIKELEEASQSSINKDKLSPILVELKRLKKIKDEEFEKRFESLIDSEHKIKYLMQKISALGPSCETECLKKFLNTPSKNLKDKLTSLEEEALNLLKKELKELQRDIEALWNISVYRQSDGSYIVYIKLLHDMSLAGVSGLHLRRGHLVLVSKGNSSRNLLGDGYIENKLDDEIQKLFEASRKVNEDASGIVKLKNQEYLELRSIRETLRALWKKLKEGSRDEKKWLGQKEWLKTFKKQLKSNLEPMIFNPTVSPNANVQTLVNEAFSRIKLNEFYEFLEKNPSLEKIDIASEACLMSLYQQFISKKNILQRQLTYENVEDASVTPLKLIGKFFSGDGVGQANNPDVGSASSPAHSARIH